MISNYYGNQYYIFYKLVFYYLLPFTLRLYLFSSMTETPQYTKSYRNLEVTLFVWEVLLEYMVLLGTFLKTL